MIDSGTDFQELTHLAFSAMQKGDSENAMRGFEQIIAAGKAQASHWLGYAYACSQ